MIATTFMGKTPPLKIAETDAEKKFDRTKQKQRVSNTMDEESFLWQNYDLAKFGRIRGKGRKGTITNAPRQKRNCSRNNHGCHGYMGEKSRCKSKGRMRIRQIILQMEINH